MKRRDVCRYFAAIVLAFMAAITPVNGSLQAQSQPGASSRAQQQGTATRDRAALEQELQRRLAEIARRELKLSNDQFTKLMAVNASFDERRRGVLVRERRTRHELRRELQKDASANEHEVERLLGQMVATQRDRLSLLEAEQKALSEFLTPVQRARYLGLQEGFRRQLDSRRQAPRASRGDSRESPGPPGAGTG